jgi:hypothetical protein
LAGNLGGISALDVIRSMMREGFSHDEVYDVLAGMGLPGEQVQLMIDRVKIEFEGAGLEPRTYRLAAEVEKVFHEEFENFQRDILVKLDSISRKIDFVLAKPEKKSNRIKTSQLKP